MNVVAGDPLVGGCRPGTAWRRASACVLIASDVTAMARGAAMDLAAVRQKLA